MVPALFGLSGLTLTDDERAFFRDADPAGYVLFGRNAQSREQVRGLTDELRSLHGRDRLFICVDQEGGRVVRLKPPVWPKYPPGEVFDRLYDLAPASAIEAARANAHALGLDLAEAGITVDLHPSLDVRQPGAHDVVGDRALGSEPMRVAALARAILDGFARAGVAGCIKHIPGHGRAMADSHKELPTVTASAEELELDIAPFRTLASAPIGMTAHVRYTAWDDENPATLSPFVVGEVIRKRIGFTGLLMSDDLDMEALSGSVPERAAGAIAAGCDLALNCWAKMDDMVGIAKTVPVMSEQGHARLDTALAATGEAHMGADHATLIAQRDSLLALRAA
ncbi:MULTISPECIES: beta-N-acetylhexosaminidase [unclassified Novosphingobium]|uniref:beta-N-acetylhexosaminidase n=1 Tax=unclassified Novosphingobium TaxID=2644732 RepID=UPI001358950F|nr:MULTISPECIES: beta-N-acetylhexosaminidase [unclassified Novosphingobium]